MYTINHAILHAFDFDTGSKYLSAVELDLSERPVRSYVQRHVRRALTSSESKHGSFEDESIFAERIADYFAGGKDFVELSQEVALYLWEQLRMSDDLTPADVLIADFEETDSLAARAAAVGTAVGDALAEAAAEASYEGQPARHFALLILPRKQAFVHALTTFGAGEACSVERTDAALPNPPQKIESYLVVDEGTLAISFADVTRAIAGRNTLLIPEGLLRCTQEASSHDVVRSVTAIVEEVAEEAGLQPSLAVAQAKAYVASNASLHERIVPKDIAESAFAEREDLRERYEARIAEERLPEEVPMRKGVANRMARKHRIVTDTGIEITFPSEYAQQPGYIDFDNTSDGHLVITIRNVARIENR